MKHLPPEQVTNPNMSGPLGENVVKIDVLAVCSGDTFEVTFEERGSEWRQGVWLATSGLLEVNGVRSAQFVVWEDTAPRTVPVRVAETEGHLWLYNVWDSGRNLGNHESQKASTGMLVEKPSAGLRRYRCNDIGWDSQFDSIVFSIQLV